jgi:hypothetical protein
VSSSEEAIKETWEKQRRDSKRVVLMEEEEQQEMSFISSEYNSNNRSVSKSVFDCGPSSERTLAITHAEDHHHTLRNQELDR